MTQFTRDFRVYLAAGVFWSLGLMTFFLVYNLYLLDVGFDEAFIGKISAAMTLGSLAITLPSGFLLNRYGINRVLQVCVLASGVSLFLRSLVHVPWLLVLFAFLNGAAIGAWMVSIPPFLTQNTRPEIRSRAFSLCYGTFLGAGALAGVLSGILSRYLASWFGAEAFSELFIKQYMLFGCSALIVLAFFPLLFLQEKIDDLTEVATPVFRFAGSLMRIQSRRFILRLLVVLVLWSFFVGSFPPFFNVFFHQRYSQSLEGIGKVFSISQFCQVLAVLSMPWLVRRVGRVPAIFFMQLAAAVFLPVLILTKNVQLAGLVYLTYLSFQVMCEPALENFIMDSVLPGERNVVSGLRYMTLFLTQALAVWISGYAIRQFGYSSLLVALAFLGVCASLTFYAFFHSRSGVGLSDNAALAAAMAPVSTEPREGTSLESLD
jgi:MFS family permease